MNTRISHLSLALSLGLLSVAPLTRAADAAAQPGVEQQIQLLQQQLDALKAQLAQQGANQGQSAPPPASSAAGADAGTPIAGNGSDLSLWGYGEIYYMHPTASGVNTTMDLARAVFGIGYRFDERTNFNSEFEVEHAVASADDAGEFEVEQFYVDRQLADWASLKAGLFLMPVGLLNEHHEPTNFYGVQRNFVETLIIPSTWREGGVGFYGSTAGGLSWGAGLTTGVNLGNWDPNPEDPLYRTAFELETNDVAPLQASHQELQFAHAQNLSQYLSVNYSGVPGLLAGASVFTGKAAVATVPVGLPSQRVTLWEGHTRWTPGAADISAVYAQGHITNTEAFNLANAGGSNPMPAKFLGYYVQAAYTLWQQQSYRLAPFVRWEHYDMGASYEGIAPGFTAVPTGLASDGKHWPQTHDRVWTFGGNFYLGTHLVVKADYQRFSVNDDFSRVDLGLGLNF